MVESLGRPYRLELELTAKQLTPSHDRLLGYPVVLHVNLGQGEARHVHGLVSEVRFLGPSGTGGEYRFIVRPWVWFLSHSQNCRIFQHQTIPEIIAQVFQGHAFSDFELRALGGQYERREFVVQYRETDLDFVTRLMEEAGLYYYFEHGADRHTLMLCDDPSAHEPLPGHAELPYLPPGSQRRELVDHVERWQATSRVEASAWTAKAFDFENPRATLLATSKCSVDHALGDLEVYDYPGDFTRAEQGEARVRLRMEERQLAREGFEGVSNSRAISCGRRLTLTEHPRLDYNQCYLVTRVSLRIEPPRAESGDTPSGPLISCDFSAALAERPFRPARVTAKPIIHGAQTAIVAGPAEQDLWVDQHGRVRVKFHWDRRAETDETASCWIRVSQAWASAGFGSLFSPRVGDEVVVEFLEGDPDRPIITGRVYNGLRVPPCRLPEQQTQSAIRSASTPGELQQHSEIRFEDRRGEELLFIQAQRDQSTRVKRNRIASVAGSDSLSVGGHRDVRVNGNLSVRVGEGGGEYRLEASATAELSAPEYLELRCKDSFIRLEPDRIQLVAGGKACIVLDTSVWATATHGASLVLDHDAVCQSADARATLKLDHDALLTSDIVRVNGAVVDIQGTTQVRINS